MAPEDSEIVQVRSGGRVKLPKFVLERLGVKKGDYVGLEVKDGTIYVIPLEFTPRNYDRGPEKS